LIGEHSFSVQDPAKSHPRLPAKDDQQAFGSGQIFPTRCQHGHILPPTLPADPMNATIIDERLAGFGRALVFLRISEAGTRTERHDLLRQRWDETFFPTPQSAETPAIAGFTVDLTRLILPSCVNGLADCLSPRSCVELELFGGAAGYRFGAPSSFRPILQPVRAYLPGPNSPANAGMRTQGAGGL
jgi:hypothetical protein